MKIILINPNLLVQKSDIFTTGIVYMPISLAYFSAVLLQKGFEPEVIDAFGGKPGQYWKKDDFLFRGLTPAEVVEEIPKNTNIVFLYASNLTYHLSLIEIIKKIRSSLFENIPLILLENTQSVTAYSLKEVQEDFYDQGLDYIVTGEAEERGLALLEALMSKNSKKKAAQIDGIGFRQKGVIHYTPPRKTITNLDQLPFPAWDLFPLENYWKLKYAHGPFQSKRYLPLLTSRGCPYSCKFCVAPGTNRGAWRGRSAGNVVDEMELHMRKFGLHEFHIEDLNPTINDKRTREICNEIIKRDLKVIWKIAAGTKVETLKNEETIELMAKAGCKYISISPESGSERVLNLMDKPFNLEHAVKMIKKMNRMGIRSQACFVLGFPGEEIEDLEMTRKMVRNLTKKGVDEVGLFIATPVPGAAIYKKLRGYTNYSQLNFSPTWREDYKKLNQFRLRLYKQFILWKMLFYPLKIVKQIFNFLFRKFETKMEMAPFRALRIKIESSKIKEKESV